MRAFVANPGFAAEMAKDPHVKAHLLKAAELTKRHAIGFAHKDTGHYDRSFVIGVSDGKVTLGNRDIAAHEIEYGSINNPVYAPLRRGVRAAGLRFLETPK